MLPAADNRIVFLIPQGDRAIVGTTDTDYAGPSTAPRRSGRHRLPAGGRQRQPARARLTATDLLSTYAGLRPCCSTAPTSRPRPRASTTLRERVGADHHHGRQAHHLAAHGEAGRRPAHAVRCRTHQLSLFATDGATRSRGSTGRGRPHRRPDPLLDGLPYVWGEVDHAVDREMARSVSDVLCRRIRVALYAEDRGAGVALAVAQRMAVRLGWDRGEITRQVDAYHVQLDENYPR
jgi:glycerol-3-phosphate dehydrogenase